jgi:crotonobetainyl-CoA:carnitine CoA-transferase CaiB-like acyl-CoA transferase
VASVKDIFADPQHAARNFWQTIEHPELQIRSTSQVARKIFRRSLSDRQALLIGEHNRRSRRELECRCGNR